MWQHSSASTQAVDDGVGELPHDDLRGWGETGTRESASSLLDVVPARLVRRVPQPPLDIRDAVAPDRQVGRSACAKRGRREERAEMEQRHEAIPESAEGVRRPREHTAVSWQRADHGTDPGDEERLPQEHVLLPALANGLVRRDRDKGDVLASTEILRQEDVISRKV